MDHLPFMLVAAAAGMIRALVDSGALSAWVNAVTLATLPIAILWVVINSVCQWRGWAVPRMFRWRVIAIGYVCVLVPLIAFALAGYAVGLRQARRGPHR